MYRQCIVITIQITIHCRYALDTVAYFSDFQPAISLYRGPHAASVSGCIVICISICIGICIGLVSGCIVICISICIGICIGLVSGLYLIPIQSLDQRTSTYVSTSYRRRILAYRKFTCIGIEIRQNSDTPDTRQIHPDTPRYSRGEKGTVLVGKKELQPSSRSSRLRSLRPMPIAPLLLPSADATRHGLLGSTCASRPSIRIASPSSRRRSSGMQMTRSAGATWKRAGRAFSQLSAQSATQRRPTTQPSTRSRRPASS